MKRLVCLSALAVSLGAFAQQPTTGKKTQPVTEKGKAAQGVNWEGQVLKATGSGAPDVRASSPAQARLGAERAAQMDAFRNLIAQAKGIQISAGKTVGDELAKDEIRGKVEGAIRAYRITDRRYYSDNGVEIDVEVPLAAITQVVSAAPEQQLAVKTDGGATHSALVIDARGLKVVPALAPRVLDADGKPVYGAEALTAEARKAHGVASYFKSLDEANKSALVGAQPLVVKAAKADGSDVILSAEDAKKLAAANQSFLAEGRVAIVTN